MQHPAITLTPRKIFVHIVMHEIRHWAQIATLLRLSGLNSGFQDLLFAHVITGRLESTATSN